MRCTGTDVLDLNLVHPDPDQPRKVKPTEYLRSLGESIKNKGLRNAIHVRPHPEKFGHYLIINGECRYTGSALVGLKTIEAKIFEYDDEENANAEIFLDQIMDNEVRKSMEPVETLQAYQRAINMGKTIAELAQAFGKSEATVEKDLPILRLPEKLLKLFDAGKIPKPVARRLAQLEKQTWMQSCWDKWAGKGKTVEEMLAKINAYVLKNNQTELNLGLPSKPTVKTSDNKERKGAMVAWKKLKESVVTFSNSPYANGHCSLMVELHEKELDDLEIHAKEMERIARKILGEIVAKKAMKPSISA